jgi:hypothetical protein
MLADIFSLVGMTTSVPPAPQGPLYLDIEQFPTAPVHDHDEYADDSAESIFA